MLILKRKVVAGRKQGRNLGFPTINIAVPRTIKKDHWGIYFSLVKVGQKVYAGITHLGPVKTFGLKKPTCETHVLNFFGDLYNQPIEKKLILKFREVQKFVSASHLKKQLTNDIVAAKKFFGL